MKNKNIIRNKFVFRIYALKDGRVQFLYNIYSLDEAKSEKIRLQNNGGTKVCYKKRRIV